MRVEIGIDWRAHSPVTLEIGAVLHPDDAVANKLAALYGRAADRDYVDVDAVLRSGRYSSADLLRLARDADRLRCCPLDMLGADVVPAHELFIAVPPPSCIPEVVEAGSGMRRGTRRHPRRLPHHVPSFFNPRWT